MAPPSTQLCKPELFLWPLLQSSFLIHHQVPVIYLLVCMCTKLLQSCLLFVTIWAIAHQAPLSMGFSRHEYQSGLPCSPPGDLPDPAIELGSLMSPALPGGFFTTSATWEGLYLLQSVRFSRSVMSDSLQPHESQHARPPCPSPTPRVHSDSVHRVSDAIQPSYPLSSPSPPAPNPSQCQSFPMSQLFA